MKRLFSVVESRSPIQSVGSSLNRDTPWEVVLRKTVPLLGKDTSYMLISGSPSSLVGAEVLFGNFPENFVGMQTSNYLWALENSPGLEGNELGGFHPRKLSDRQWDGIDLLISSAADAADNLVVVSSYDVADSVARVVAQNEEVEISRDSVSAISPRVHYLDLEAKTYQYITDRD